MHCAVETHALFGWLKHVGDSHRPRRAVRMRAEDGDGALSKTQERPLHTLARRLAAKRSSA